MSGFLATPFVSEIAKSLDGLFTSDEERLAAKAKITEILQRPDLAQIETNKIEAAHTSIFVAGWRPAIGWICAASLGYHFIFRDLFIWAVQLGFPAVPAPPTIDPEYLTNIVMAMLGLGGLRTIEKVVSLKVRP